MVERNSRSSSDPTDAFKFSLEERIQCSGSGKVKYMQRADTIMQVPVPVNAAINKEAVAEYERKKKEAEEQKRTLDPKELVRPFIPMSACMEAFGSTADVEDFYSSALQAKTIARKSTRLATFPDFLFIQLKKFTIGDDWVPKKLDVSVGMPDQLDLSSLRGSGLQPGEQELPDSSADAAPAEPEVEIDEGVVAQLASMGFALEGCKKAVYHTKNTGVENAMNWVMEHMGDPDFSDPLQLPGKSGGSSGGFVPSEEALVMIMSMGFTKDQATRALKETDNNVERAADWIFSHAGELDTPMDTEEPAAGAYAAAAASDNCRDGPAKYELVAFISHMGTSTLVGHYVCHIKKEGRWVIFNDEKVALSEKPPRDLGYLYLYRRVQS